MNHKNKGDRLQLQIMFSCTRTGIKFQQLPVNSVCMLAVITSPEISRSL